MLEYGSTQHDVATAFGVTQRVVSQAWNRYLATTSDVPAKDAYDARPLAQSATSAKWLYFTFTVLPEHSRLTFCKPQDTESVTQLHSRRPARGPILTREHRGARLDLPRIINIGSCVIADSMSLLVTDVREYGGVPVNGILTSTSSNTTNTVVVRDGMGRHLSAGELTAVWYRDEVLEPVVRPFAGPLGQDFYPEAPQCQTSHGQSRPSLPGAGKHRRHGVASAIPTLESD